MYKRYWFILALLVICSPLGLLANGTAWGEWDRQDLKETLGYVPQGLEQLSNRWQAIFPDYNIHFLGEGTLSSFAGYILSALIGSLLVYTLILFIAKRLFPVRNKQACSDK
ncbi:biosynthesis cobalamin cbim cobalt precursor signal nickel membrane abc protein [Lucifera butyrica]|uniref:Biosynthesis cobalamin cbim cobalt signal nickel membrane abc protein n=1 Tax=Lucifera butyrica TaxID=1351585 RepID=A0A498R4R0_9FIRM|nr:PDGLE domain-containing protein [Lucifera butyrica]VBB07676.1 biosynthesis cobalamin cbim cobalt precursor signal nickel membrane abc protein [Lucifera butyrica]